MRAQESPIFTACDAAWIMHRRASCQLAIRWACLMSPACSDCRSFGRQTRRDVLRAGALSLFGISMPRLLFGRDAAAAQAVSRGGSFEGAKSSILLFMWGGT